MATLPDKAFDLAIVDPPYGIGMNAGNGNYSHALFKKQAKTWDDNRPTKEYWQELFRVSVNQIVWGANYFTEHLPPSMGWIVWYKSDECKGRDFGECEIAFSSFNKALRHFEEKPFQRNRTRIHPTQKPIKLYRWILHHYALPGQRILDTHLGSGSIAIAAHQMGFDFVGCEIDRDYYDAACKRFKEQTMQQSLFKP